MTTIPLHRYGLGLALTMLVALGVSTTWSYAQSRSATKGSAAEVEAPESPAVTGPKIIAVKFHADWCGYCKAMGDVYQEMQAKFDQKPVLWITLDHTREHGRMQAEYLAHALDMEAIWAEYGGKTGFILLVNARTGEVVDKLTHEQTLKQMGARLAEAVERAGS